MSQLAFVEGVLVRLHSFEVVTEEELEKEVTQLREDLAHVETFLADMRRAKQPAEPTDTPAAAEQPAEQPAPTPEATPVEAAPAPEAPATDPVAQPEQPAEQATPQPEAPAEPIVLQ